jgi:phage baseplate assembly protein W
MAAATPAPESSAPPGSPLGTGWSFPPSFDRFSGGARLSSDVDNVRENLQILFSTDVGERIMLATYGTPLRQHLFRALTETTSNQLKLEINNVITEWEPRIDVLDIKITDQQELSGACELTIHFQLRAKGARGTMIYPFYLSEGGLVPPSG